MRFFGVMVLTIALLQRQGRISYRALKRGFELDDAALEDLRRELIGGEARKVTSSNRTKLLEVCIAPVGRLQ